jgi:hypothetical protein
MIGRVVFWTAVILAVLWVIHHPAQADTDVKNIGSALSGLVS